MHKFHFAYRFKTAETLDGDNEICNPPNTVLKITYLFLIKYAIRKNNGRGDTLREVGCGTPVSNNTKPKPVKVVALKKTRPCGRGAMNLPLTVNSHIHSTANAARLSTNSSHRYK